MLISNYTLLFMDLSHLQLKNEPSHWAVSVFLSSVQI